MPELTVAAPAGSHFAWEEVKTAKATKSLGEVPILVWDDADAMIDFITKPAILDMADGTSLRVSYQSIARRYRSAAEPKTDDQIAQAQVDFRPGKRIGGVSTPESRAKRAAGTAAEKLGGDAVTELLLQLTSGKISKEDLAALLAG